MTQRICQSKAFHAHQTGMAVVISFFVAFLAFGGVATAQNPVPFINQPLVPDAAKPGGAEFTLTVNGTGFVPGSVVRWNGSMRKTMFVSKMRLTATITASDIAKARTAVITVLNPSPGGGKSNTVFFEVTLPTPSIALAKAGILALTLLRWLWEISTMTATWTWPWRMRTAIASKFCWAGATEPSMLPCTMALARDLNPWLWEISMMTASRIWL